MTPTNDLSLTLQQPPDPDISLSVSRESLTGRLLLVIVRLAHHQLVLALPERIRVDGDWFQVDVGVSALGLASGGAVKVPDWQL